MNTSSSSISRSHVTSDDCIYISDHAFKRMKERAGWNSDAALRMAGKVYEKGERIQPTTVRLKKWFDVRNLFNNDTRTYRHKKNNICKYAG